MKPVPVIAIFDIGKTNKKFFLFNEQYKIVLEHSVQFEETVDDDGFPCDDINRLTTWVKEQFHSILSNPSFEIKAINYSAYGASFVLLGSAGHQIGPLYNYLKPFTPSLLDTFYSTYGGEEKVSVETASPKLGNLNSGLQLYSHKNEKPAFFEKVQTALHLPQYISYLITGKSYADISSIGCHTLLWDFKRNCYHEWVEKEGILEKLPSLFPSNKTVDIVSDGYKIISGIGLHDSSSALIPYLANFSEPFLLISTGTWCISLNPFNNEPLTPEELAQDCLCYLTYTGKPVKASRYFAGNEHEQQTKLLAAHFNVSLDEYKQVNYLPDLWKKMNADQLYLFKGLGLKASAFATRDISKYSSYEEAYHQLMFDIMQQHKHSTSLVLGCEKLTRIFVDGGFAKNPVYMHMLAEAFPDKEVYAASVSQASAIGAALAIHDSWNAQPVPGDMVELKYYTVTH